MELALTELIIGQRGKGKTSLAKYLTHDCRRLVCIDPHLQLSRQGVIHTDTEAINAVPDVVAKMMGDSWRIVFRYDEPRERIAWVFYQALTVGDCVVFIDELPYFAPAVGSLFPGLEKLLRFGRDRNVRFVGTAHRPQDISSLFLGEAEFYLCRIFEPNAIKKLEQFFPRARELENLPDPEVRGGALHLTFVRPFADNERVTVSVPLGIL